MGDRLWAGKPSHYGLPKST